MADRHSRQAREAFEERHYRYEPKHRMALPRTHYEVFEEMQPFDQVWLWVIMAMEVIIVLVSLFAAGTTPAAVVPAVLVLAIPLALLSAIRLNTRIDDEGIHFKLRPFHWRVQTIAWEEIDQVYVRKYSPIMEYGGWGIRYGRQGKAFNIKGNYGIQVVRKNGKRLLIGTQEPERAAEALGRHLVLV